MKPFAFSFISKSLLRQDSHAKRTKERRERLSCRDEEDAKLLHVIVVAAITTDYFDKKNDFDRRKQRNEEGRKSLATKIIPLETFLSNFYGSSEFSFFPLSRQRLFSQKQFAKVFLDLCQHIIIIYVN